MKITAVYFSATSTTKTISLAVAKGLSDEVVSFDITNRHIEEDIRIAPDELLLVGMPVYAGRIPALTVESLKHFKGSHSPVILLAIYGNREFDDALVEMQDIFEANGFFVAAGAAFIAQHSIFPQTAKGRPDAADYEKINAFSARCRALLEQGFAPDAVSVALPGNRPYKIPGSIPLKVETSSACVECGACIKACPVGAISPDDPHVTNADICIHCARCIFICKEHARHFGAPLYQVAGAKFNLANRKRKEPQVFF